MKQLILGLGLALGITSCFHLNRNVKEPSVEQSITEQEDTDKQNNKQSMAEQKDGGNNLEEKSEKEKAVELEQWQKENSPQRQAADKSYEECLVKPNKKTGQRCIDANLKYALSMVQEKKESKSPYLNEYLFVPGWYFGFAEECADKSGLPFPYVEILEEKLAEDNDWRKKKLRGKIWREEKTAALEASFKKYLGNPNEETKWDCFWDNARFVARQGEKSRHLDYAKECAGEDERDDLQSLEKKLKKDKKEAKKTKKEKKRWRKKEWKRLRAANRSHEKCLKNPSKETARKCVKDNLKYVRQGIEEDNYGHFPPVQLEYAKECADQAAGELLPKVLEVEKKFEEVSSYGMPGLCTVGPCYDTSKWPFRHVRRENSVTLCGSERSTCKLEDELKAGNYRICSQAAQAKIVLVGIEGNEEIPLAGCLKDEDLVFVGGYHAGENLEKKENKPSRMTCLRFGKKTKTEGLDNLQLLKELREYRGELKFIEFEELHGRKAANSGDKDEFVRKIHETGKKMMDGYLAQIRKHAGEDSPGKVYFVLDADLNVADFSSSLTKEGIKHIAYCPNKDVKEK